MAEKKKQHYVPKFYLNNFVAKADFERMEAYLYVHCDGNVRKRSPANTGYKNYYYTVDVDGLERNHIEDLFSVIESDTKSVIQRVLALGLDMITEHERYLLARFISFLFVRTPKMRELNRIALSRVLKEYVHKNVQKNGIPNKFDLDENDVLNILNSEWNFPKEGLIGMSMGTAIRYLPMFADRNWYLLYSSGKTFITSDHPVVLYNKNVNMTKALPGLAMPDTDFYLPLSSTVCLYGTYSYSTSKKVSDSEVLFINELVNQQKTHFVFSCVELGSEI